LLGFKNWLDGKIVYIEKLLEIQKLIRWKNYLQ
jgi:hypothetical protein